MASTASITVDLSSTGLDRLLTDSHGPVGNHLRNIANRVRTQARANVPERSGNLKDSIKVHQELTPTGLIFKVGSNLRYALYLHEGTGQNSGGYVYPVHAQFLRFQGSDGKFLYRRRVRGVDANPFLADALRTVIGGGG